MVMSGSDTEELPTAGDLNNKHGASYLYNCLRRMQHNASLRDASAALADSNFNYLPWNIVAVVYRCALVLSGTIFEGFPTCGRLVMGSTLKCLMATHRHSTVQCTQ